MKKKIHDHEFAQLLHAMLKDEKLMESRGQEISARKSRRAKQIKAARVVKSKALEDAIAGKPVLSQENIPQIWTDFGLKPEDVISLRNTTYTHHEFIDLGEDFVSLLARVHGEFSEMTAAKSLNVPLGGLLTQLRESRFENKQGDLVITSLKNDRPMSIKTLAELSDVREQVIGQLENGMGLDDPQARIDVIRIAQALGYPKGTPEFTRTLAAFDAWESKYRPKQSPQPHIAPIDLSRNSLVPEQPPHDR